MGGFFFGARTAALHHVPCCGFCSWCWDLRCCFSPGLLILPFCGPGLCLGCLHGKFDVFPNPFVALKLNGSIGAPDKKSSPMPMQGVWCPGVKIFLGICFNVSFPGQADHENLFSSIQRGGSDAVVGDLWVCVVITGLGHVGDNQGASQRDFSSSAHPKTPRLLSSPGSEEVRCHHSCASVRSDLRQDPPGEGRHHRHGRWTPEGHPHPCPPRPTAPKSNEAPRGDTQELGVPPVP